MNQVFSEGAGVRSRYFWRWERARATREPGWRCNRVGDFSGAVVLL